MKKILMLMIVAFATISVKAITVDEAYNQLAETPGAALSEVPEYDCTKEGMDWGKVVMFIRAQPATLTQVESILGDITDPVVLDQMAQDNNHVIGYAAKQEDGRTRALVSVTMPGVGIVVIYAQGGDDVVSGMNIN